MRMPETGDEPPVSEEVIEAQLRVGLRARDEKAFEALVRLHGRQLLLVARRFLRNEEDARDAVQDAFLSAWRSLESFQGESRISTWLHRITVNAALMKLRTRRRKPEESLDHLLPSFLEDGHQQDPAVEWLEPADVAIERRETRELVRRAIDRLPDSYRAILLMRDIEEIDTEEAARVLEVSPNAVKTRLHRARQALRTLLDPEFRESAPRSGKPGHDPMTCRELFDFLEAYASGDLSTEPRAAFDRHLTVCPPCVAYLESYKGTIRLAKGAFAGSDEPLPADVPPELVQAVRDALKKEG